MKSFHRCIVAGALVVAPAAFGQSQFMLLPNPLIKPSARQAVAKVGREPVLPEKPAAMAPYVVPVAQRVDGAGPASPGGSLLAPLPPDAVELALSGKGWSGSSVAVQEVLARYTVTAVLADVAVLRTNVGGATMTPAAPGGATNPANGANATPLGDRGRQQVLRVRSGQAVTIGGISVVPTVMASQVDFTLAGKGAVIYSAPLDSLSPHQYAVPSALKEAADPGMPARVLPVATGTPSGAMQSGGAGSTAGAPYAPSATSPR